MTKTANLLKPRIVFVTPHHYEQKRRTGFYWLADAFHQLHWQVLFFTAPFSLISLLNRKQQREVKAPWRERGRLLEKKRNFFSYVHFTLWHKVDFRQSFLRQLGALMNRLVAKLSDAQSLQLGASLQFMQTADIIVFESAPCLELSRQIRIINSKAKLIYRVSDDLDMLRVHPDTRQFEHQHLELFERVSCPSQAIYNKLKQIDAKANVCLEYHGINKQLFDRDYPNPYVGKSDFPVIFVGIGNVDYPFLQRVSQLFPHWQFHLIGPLQPVLASNVIMYGELPFTETIPYLKYAKIGLQCRQYSKGAEALTDTLKILQYSYCRLAIVAPSFLQTKRANTFYYESSYVNNHNDTSIKQAMLKAAAYQANQDIYDYRIGTWQDLARQWISH